MFLSNRYINFRKKYILPIKWILKELFYRANLKTRSKKEILDKIKELEEYIDVLRRVGQSYETTQVKIETLNWVLYKKNKE